MVHFKAGSTAPLRFSLTNDSGAAAGALAPKLYLAKLSSGIWGSEAEPVSTNRPDLGSTFREIGAGSCMFNLSIKSLSSCLLYTSDAADE